jgi:hypothetical protein
VTAVRPRLDALLIVWERDEGRCAKCGHEVSGERGYDWSLHHRRPAGMGGDRRSEAHAPGNLVLLHGSGTTSCHGEVEKRRANSFAAGLLVLRSDTPTERPIEHAVHGWVYLRDDGTVSMEPPGDAA